MEDYSLTLKKLSKFPRPFPENHGNEEKAGKSYQTKLANLKIPSYMSPFPGLQPEGGTFRNGEYGWLSAGSYLEVVEMNSGFKVSRFDFASQFE